MGKFTEYNVPLKSLAPGVHEFEYHLEQPFLTTWRTTRFMVPTSM